MDLRKPLKPRILAAKVITQVERGLAEQWGLADWQRSVGLVTCDIDDSLYVALDEATKCAEVEVAYAHSFYAGSGNASGPLSGEVIGMLAGPSPSEVRAGLDACIAYATEKAWFYTADAAGELAYFPHLISSTGSYLSAEAGIAVGEPLAYLIAPPLEASYALDQALKAAEVEVRTYYRPPSETNFSGALLTGSQSACRAACDAFSDAVLAVAADPTTY